MKIDVEAFNEAAAVYHDGSYAGYPDSHLKAIIEAYESAKADNQQGDEWILDELKHILDLAPPDKTLLGYARTLGTINGIVQGILEDVDIERRSRKRQRSAPDTQQRGDMYTKSPVSIHVGEKCIRNEHQPTAPDKDK